MGFSDQAQGLLDTARTRGTALAAAGSGKITELRSRRDRRAHFYELGEACYALHCNTEDRDAESRRDEALDALDALDANQANEREVNDHADR
jgi:hypothetical protein